MKNPSGESGAIQESFPTSIRHPWGVWGSFPYNLRSSFGNLLLGIPEIIDFLVFYSKFSASRGGGGGAGGERNQIRSSLMCWCWNGSVAMKTHPLVSIEIFQLINFATSSITGKYPVRTWLMQTWIIRYLHLINFAQREHCRTLTVLHDLKFNLFLNLAGCN